MGIGKFSFSADEETLAQCWYRIVDRRLGAGKMLHRIFFGDKGIQHGEKETNAGISSSRRAMSW